MKAKETHVARDESLIPSPIMKSCVFPFITKADTSPIPNIERRALQMNVLVSYVPYKARSQLGHNSVDARSALFLRCSYRFFPFFGVAL
jgi:hypothetical protein